MESVLKELSSLQDGRRGAGQRHNQAVVLLLAILATMNGSVGYRAIGDFIQANRVYLLSILPLKKLRLPSFSTVRRVLMRVDSQALGKVVSSWSSQPLPLEEVKLYAADGKGIKGTMENYASQSQDFTSLLSVLELVSSQVVAVQSYQNGKESEIAVLGQVIQALKTQPGVLMADALDCQKKQ